MSGGPVSAASSAPALDREFAVSRCGVYIAHFYTVTEKAAMEHAHMRGLSRGAAEY